ncbi:hypothetical protein J2X11_001690 [Aeromicrobium panaciterrae]|uniref:Uncharacterized protein n=1 Tax=Aeromicrobium panaciterrae TaxID=363861 RepID=A0ABU1UNV7_9ACTN|nr:hypothetical protein [Aeromicrobium panaciterrae]MDR7086851.1 hypothetical protein [Aeromicrobium panaciterrae]
MNPLQQPTLVAYYDARMPVVEQAATRLQALDRAEAEVALAHVAEHVRDLAHALPADRFDMIAVSVVDDLYKTISNAAAWSEEADLYIGAVFGSFLGVAADRGRHLQYVIDNLYEDLTRPLHIFPYVFTAAGLVYACPQHSAAHLAKVDGGSVGETPAVEGLAFWIAEGRYLAREVVFAAAAAGRHFVYLDANLEEGGLEPVLELSAAPGVVSVFRNEAPTDGSNVSVRIG